MIDKNKIRPGDLLLFRIVKESCWLGKLIGWFSVFTGNGGTYNRTYGHAALCVDQDYYIEQTFPKSRKTKMCAESPEVELWRVCGLSAASARKAVGWGLGNLGKWYNIKHIVSFGCWKGYGCSDFVFNCFKESGTGVILDKNNNDIVVSPNEITECGIVECIDNGGHS